MDLKFCVPGADFPSGDVRLLVLLNSLNNSILVNFILSSDNFLRTSEEFEHPQKSTGLN